ncbi:unnamed protein product [Meganyctiphanes norvegica]|uniref:C2H2-type domain-containing protein n=1 Tax=Meganyctiphanes norvegica TaxID=48144 RepID=A0AAV2QID3_MEGNR
MNIAHPGYPIEQHITHQQRHQRQQMQQQQPQILQQQQLQHDQQQPQQQKLYKCNECGSMWANLKTLWIHQRKHLNFLGEGPSPPSSNATKIGPGISAPIVSNPMKFRHFNDNSISINSENLHKFTIIPQGYSLEPDNIYAPEPTKICNPEINEIFIQQPHMIINSQHPKAYNIEPQEICENLKRIESEFRSIEKQKLSEHSDTMEGVNIENSFFKLQHNIYLKEVDTSQEFNAPIESCIDNQEDPFKGVEIEKDKFYLEFPDKKCHPNILRHKKVKDCTDNKESEPEGDNVLLQQLFAESTPIIDVIRWLQQHQLLKSEMKCDSCEQFMTWKYNHWDMKWKDKYFWKCENSKCSSVYCTKTIRAGSIFDGSRLFLKQWLLVMYKWSKNIGSSATSKQMNISRKTIMSYYSFLRDICEVYFKENPIKLGGPGIHIEFDVFCLSPSYSNKQKCKHRSEHQPPILVLCIIDTECTPSIGYMEVVKTRDVDLLIPIIFKVVQPGSIIHSEDWREYNKIQALSDMGRTHSVNQSVNFIDANCECEHKQAIESYWNKHKSYYTAMKGTRRSNLNSYLKELMWHERFCENTLEILCEQIAVQYSDALYIDNTSFINLYSNLKLEKEAEKQVNRLKVNLGKITNISEPPHKKSCSRVQQGRHSIFQANITPEDSAPNTSNNNNKEDTCSREEIKNCTKKLEEKFEENINYLEEPSSQQEKQCSNKVDDCTDGEDSSFRGDNVILRLVTKATPIIDVIRWLQEHQLLKSKMMCDRCEHFMTWKYNHLEKKWKDGFYWKCENSKCPNLYCTKTIRAGSMFDGSKLYLKEWLIVMYNWSKNIGSSATSKQINFSRKTIIKFYSYIREICEIYFKVNPVKLGGPGKTIDVDVFCPFPQNSNKQKLDKAQEPQNPIWILCIVDSSCTPSIGYMEVVETRDVATLLPIILKVVQPGSIVHSVEWKAYSYVQGLSDTAGAVKHSIKFVDVNTYVDNKVIESYWKNHKNFYTSRGSTSRSNLNSYLQEIMWHERFSDNCLKILCEQIAIKYSEASYIDKTDESCSREKQEKRKKYLDLKLYENPNSLEPPRKKFHYRAQQKSHSIFRNSITKESIALDASYVNETDESCLGEEMDNPMSYLDGKLEVEENLNYLEEMPPKQCHLGDQQGTLSSNKKCSEEKEPESYNDNVIRHSIFKDSITQESSALDNLYINKKDESCSGEEMDNPTSCLEEKLEVEENLNYLEEMPPKNCHLGNQQGTLSSNKKCSEEKEPESNNDKVIWLFAEATPVIDVIRWFQQHQLLKKLMKCDHCKHPMTWKYNHWDKKWKDGFYWKCENSKCPNLYCTKTIRAGSIFDGSKLCLKDWLIIMYNWCKNFGSSATSDQVNISRKTIINYYNFIRNICEVYFKANPIKLGGPGITIEIDVFCPFHQSSHKSKDNHEPEPVSNLDSLYC